MPEDSRSEDPKPTECDACRSTSPVASADSKHSMDASAKAAIVVLGRKFMALRRAYAYMGGRARLGDMDALARASIVVDPEMKATFATFLGCAHALRSGEDRGVRGANYDSLDDAVMEAARHARDRLMDLLDEEALQAERGAEELAKEGTLA